MLHFIISTTFYPQQYPLLSDLSLIFQSICKILVPMEFHPRLHFSLCEYSLLYGIALSGQQGDPLCFDKQIIYSMVLFNFLQNFPLLFYK